MSRKRLVAVASLFLCVIVAVVFTSMRPSGPRYQGATVRQWCVKFTKTRTIPTDDVIEAFGTEAIPHLLSYLRTSSHVYKLRCALRFPPVDNRGGQTAYEWMRKLYEKDAGILDDILLSESKSAPMMLKILSVSESSVRQKLDAVTNSTLSQVRLNATAALQMK